MGMRGCTSRMPLARSRMKDDAFVVTQLGGDSPFGGVLCSLGSDYAVHMSPDGSGRSVFAGLDITTPLGNGKGWYLRDSESGEIWSPFFGPVCEKADEHEVAFSPGQATAYALKNKIATTLTVATLPDRPLEVWLVRIENRSAIERSLTFTTYIEPCIGPDLEAGYKDRKGAAHAQASVGAGPPCVPPCKGGREGGRRYGPLPLQHPHARCATRPRKSEFIGEGRSLRNPKELDSDQSTGTDGAAAKPIASLTVQIELPIEGEAEFAFCFGVAHSPEHAIELTRGLSKTRLAKDAVENSRKRWEELSSTLSMRSPDRSLNSLVNTWLPYEAYAGWIGQRTGGVCLDPAAAADALRRSLCVFARPPRRCAARACLSFAAGISASGAYSPDSESVMVLPAEELLWLAACTARYVAETGDVGVLAETIARRDGPGLTLKEHCERAMRLCREANGVSEAMLEARAGAVVTGHRRERGNRPRCSGLPPSRGPARVSRAAHTAEKNQVLPVDIPDAL